MALVSKPRVINGRTDKTTPGVYIGRPSKWGNPFMIGRDGTREGVIAKFEKYLVKRPGLVIAAQTELRGHNLRCYCAPEACHGDVLLRLANGGDDDGLGF